MADDPIVKVSLIQPMSFRANKADEYTKYGRGVSEMPLSHAKGLGVLNRVVKETPTGEVVTAKSLPFGGTFDEKVTSALEGAGITTLDELRKASRDEILAIPGIGPAAFTVINEALKGGE